MRQPKTSTPEAIFSLIQGLLLTFMQVTDLLV